MQTPVINTGDTKIAQGPNGVPEPSAIPVADPAPALLTLARKFRGRKREQRALDATGMNRGELAARMAVTTQTLRKWSRGETMSSLAGIMLAEMETDPEYWTGFDTERVKLGDAELVRAARNALECSQGELAAALLVTLRTVKRWEGPTGRLPVIGRRWMEEFLSQPRYWRDRLLPGRPQPMESKE
ncbi:MAG: helix-turn-helix domain-containing protein [Planctomycetaceae bacterium]